MIIFTPEAGRLEQVGLIESRVVIPEANRRISGQAIAEGFYVAPMGSKGRMGKGPEPVPIRTIYSARFSDRAWLCETLDALAEVS